MKFRNTIAIVAMLAVGTSCSAQKFNLLVGTYDLRPGRNTTGPTIPGGITIFEFDAATGKVTPKKEKFVVESPSYLTLSANEKFVYTVSEGSSSGLNALSYNSKTGEFKLLNTVKSGSGGPTYISTDPAGKYIFAGNYGGGSMTAVAINPDGSLVPEIMDFKHTGKSVAKNKPFTHSAVVSPDGKFVVTADLGTDSINAYSINGKEWPKGIKSVGAVGLAPGAGPRHSAFSPNGKFVYVMTELNSTVNVISFNNGKMELIQSLSTIPSDYTGIGDGADIKVSADGKFVYASTRNKLSTMFIYSVDQKTGKLTAVGKEPLQAVSSRTFTIDPTGKWIIVTSQGTKELIVFKRDPKTGLMSPTGDKITLDTAPGIAKFSKI